MFVVDDSHLGNPPSVWARSPIIASLPSLHLSRHRRAVVVAPHPDDEIIGAGGLIQQLALQGLPISILAVTDGEASHPGSQAVSPKILRRIRRIETDAALIRLGVAQPQVTRLAIPDGEVARFTGTLYDALAALLHPDDLCLAPWSNDGHPDHDAAGLAAARASQTVGATFLGYLVWAWHWARPEGADLPWRHCARLTLDRRAAARKRWATGALVSQTRPLGTSSADRPILPPAVLRRAWQRFEVFVSTDAMPDAGPSGELQGS